MFNVNLIAQLTENKLTHQLKKETSNRENVEMVLRRAIAGSSGAPDIRVPNSQSKR
jgi:hypothetical protein